MKIDSRLVRQDRARRGWTQQQLADIADLSLRTVQRVENQYIASQETASALCAVLELDRTELLAPELEQEQVADRSTRWGWWLMLALLSGMALGCGLTLALMGR